MDQVELNFHISVLKYEVDILTSRLQPHDTGHLHTTISVLKERIQELEKQLSALSSAG